MKQGFASILEEHTRAVNTEFGQPVVFASPDVREHMDGLLATPFQRTRDADALEISNWEVISRDLIGRFPDDVEDHHFGHWAVGWVDRLYVRRGASQAMAAVGEWMNALADYPVADEMHYAETEDAENHPDADSYCYSDDPDCGCGREAA